MSPAPPNVRVLSFDYPDESKPCLSPRQQTPTQTTDASTSSTSFDYWWPYPLATTTTTSSSSSSTPSPSSSQSLNSTTILSSSQTVSSTASSSSSTTSPSQTLNSLSASKSPFNIIDVIPAIAAAGIFLLGLGIWLVYGCCTRRPRIRKDDGELICGPPYSRGDYDDNHDDDDDAGHHERRGNGIQILIHREIDHDQRVRGDEDELVIPKRSHHGRDRTRDRGRGRTPVSQSRFNRHGQTDEQQQYRWPSYNEPPPFDTNTGFYIPDAYKDPEGDGDYFTATLLAPPSGAGTGVGAGAGGGSGRRNKFSRSRTNRSVASKSGVVSTTTTLSPKSDCTSIALLELYESENEDEDENEEKEKAKHRRRRATEVPWESLRHKSIKRGILEQVKKDKDKEKESRKRWMDSIKSSFTGGSGRGSMRVRDEQEIVPLQHNGIEGKGEGEVEEQDEANRRGRRSVLNAGPSGYSNDMHLPTKSLPPLPPGQVATVRTPGGRRTFVQLKDDPQDLDKYTRLPNPTRNTPSRSRSRSRSQSRGGGAISNPSPTSKRRSHRANSRSRHQYRPLSLTDHEHEREEHEEHELVLGGTGPGSISRDVLPSSPPQLMSPPLESQIFFTPPLRSTTTFNNSILSPEVRPTNNKNPTRTTTAEKKTKSRKLHSRTPPRLPFPGSGRSGGMTSPRPDMYRGRLVKKQKSIGVRESRLDGHGNTSGGVDSECKEAMRKVDRIIKSSLSARDLVE